MEFWQQKEEWAEREAKFCDQMASEYRGPLLDAGVSFALCVSLGCNYRWSEYVAIIYLANTLRLRHKLSQGVQHHVCPFPSRVPQ